MNPVDPNALQLPYLETFSKAAELSSFTATAKALGLTQAAISQRIQALERMLGTSLFHRQGGRILLTEGGQQLYSYAQKIFELHRGARQAITGRRVPISGELFLGASTIPGEYFLPAILSSFHKKFPLIEVRASVSDSMDVIRKVERGDIQLGLVGRRTESVHLEFLSFAHDRMVLVVPSKHAWSKRRKVSLNQLCQQPIILREADSGLRYCFEKELTRLGKSVRDLQIALELGSNEAIKKAVMRKVGIAILSTFAVEKELKSRHLHALRVTDLHCDSEMFVVWDRRRVLSGAASAFRFFLETYPVRDIRP